MKKHKNSFHTKRIRDYEILILGRAIAFSEQKNDEYNLERYKNIFQERVGKNKFLTQAERSDIYIYCGDFYLQIFHYENKTKLNRCCKCGEKTDAIGFCDSKVEKIFLCKKCADFIATST